MTLVVMTYCSFWTTDLLNYCRNSKTKIFVIKWRLLNNLRNLSMLILCKKLLSLRKLWYSWGSRFYDLSKIFTAFKSIGCRLRKLEGKNRRLSWAYANNHYAVSRQKWLKNLYRSSSMDADSGVTDEINLQIVKA